MANRSFMPTTKSYGAATVVGGCQFAAGGTLAPVAPGGVSGGDIIASFAHTAGTNIIQVTLKDPFNLVIECHPELRDDGGAGLWASVGTFANEGTTLAPTFNINYFNASGATLVDPTAVTMLSFFFRNTGMPESDEK